MQVARAIVVTRPSGGSVVLLSLEEYERIDETVHLLRSPANAARLLRSIADADAGRLGEHEPLE